MSPRQITLNAHFFDKAERVASDQLAIPDNSADNNKALHFPGLELLGYLGAKIVVPIVCAFVKDVLYEQYKSLKTKKAADQAKELLATTQGPFKLAVDRDTLVSELTGSLVAEGLSPDVAKKAVQQTVSYVEHELIDPSGAD